jgi:hypothetical protein
MSLQSVEGRKLCDGTFFSTERPHDQQGPSGVSSPLHQINQDASSTLPSFAC